MNRYSYLILVEVPAMGTMQDIVAALQRGYDDGHAEGQFEVIVTHEPGYLVTFLRSTAEDDMKYLQDRMREGAENLSQAAMRQLGAELNGTVGDSAKPIVEALLEGDAQIIDFNGVLKRVPIVSICGAKSISDDDLCATCSHCTYRPGELSSCALNWPGFENSDGYVEECPSADPKG
ncbi:hypothetical protein RQP54_18045 [Curvibacter sp. APW13]|uniref:hypothetical protein n=1 Tax=Curvibacter sp. APW13 TaxID=3077236 RepID=UPI0028DD4FD0|nr:hypothetical protein [Curvibacter sp. APW13]MDT8992780.1 hypothetical protein [Curvibacter sp. APW13]